MAALAKAAPKASKPDKYAPILSIDEDMLPAVADWGVGESYTVTLKVKMVSKHQGEMYQTDGDGADSEVSGSFKVLSVSSPDAKPKPSSRSDKISRIRERAKE